MLGGYIGRVLDVNLTSGAIETRVLTEEDVSLYLGGKGIAVRLLYDNTPAAVDPLGPENVLIFSTGPLVGTFAPLSNRFAVVSKSPLTGGIGYSTCGGSFAGMMKKAGFDVILVRGRASRPVLLEVLDGKAEVKDAADLWGLGTYETQARLPKRSGKAVIGPAGENGVLYAAILSEERAAARCGLGAVMGSKNLKAVVADGSEKVGILDDEGFKEYRKRLTELFRNHPQTGRILPRLGTASLVMMTAGKNILPTFNYRQGSHPDAIQISGEAMAESDLVKNDGCVSCPVHCGRVIERQGRQVKGPEFETIAKLGSDIGNFDRKMVYELNYLCDDLGMDTISAGGTLAFAMELTERGMLKSDLAFGRTDNLPQVLDDVAHKRGLGADLALGVKRLSEKYGGREFAMHVKGLELPGYDPRGCYGQGLEYATTNRGGCHVQGSLMYLEATGPFNLNPHSTEAKPELVVMQQNLFAAISSAMMCVFSTYPLIPAAAFSARPHGPGMRLIQKLVSLSGPVLALSLKGGAPVQVMWYEKFLSFVLGRKITLGDFQKVGERVFNLERLYNLREGKSREEDTLPDRLLHESTFSGIQGGVPLEGMLPRYFRLRGWDERGVPSEKTLAKLDIRR